MAKKMPKGLAKYHRLRKKAKAKGIPVPRGTSVDELEALVSGKTTVERSKRVTKARQQTKANRGKGRKVPKGARSAKILWGFE